MYQTAVGKKTAQEVFDDAGLLVLYSQWQKWRPNKPLGDVCTLLGDRWQAQINPYDLENKTKAEKLILLHIERLLVGDYRIAYPALVGNVVEYRGGGQQDAAHAPRNRTQILARADRINRFQ